MNCEDENNPKNNYRFDFTDDEVGRSVSLEFEIDDSDPWWEVLQEFLNFLSAVYGYDIHKEMPRYYQENAGSNLW